MTSYICSSSKATKIAPEANLITMIKNFEKDEDLLRQLKNFPKSLHDADEDEKTVLMWAVEKGRDCIVEKGLSHGINIENTDNDGWNAIMYAARRGNMAVLKMLLDYGGELNRASLEDGFTALHLAAGNGLIEVCKALLKAGANPNILDASKKKPIDHIKDKRQKEMYNDCLVNTYKEGQTPDRLHQDRLDQSVDKSLNRVMTMINKTAVEEAEKIKQGVALDAEPDQGLFDNLNDSQLEAHPSAESFKNT